MTDELVAYDEMGAGSVLTFLHPIGLNGSWFMPELELMSPTARALAPDLPGHGRSASYDGNLSIQSIGETVVALWDHLGIHRAAIVGISLGGMVAQTIATSHPSRVNSLMLVSTTSGSDTKGRAAMDKRARVVEADGMSALAEDTMRRWFTDSAIVADAPFLSAARNTLLSGDPTAHAAYWRAIGDFDHRSSLPAIRARTQIVVGDQDVSTPVTAAEAIAAGIPDAQLVVVSGGTHMFPFEERKLFAQLVQDFWNHETSGGPDHVARPEGGR